MVQAQSGQAIELTSHRKVVARLVGVLPVASEGAARLVSIGAASWQGGKPAGAALVLQAGSDAVKAWVDEAEAVAVCRIAWAEAHAALSRRVRETPTDAPVIEQAKAALAP